MDSSLISDSSAFHTLTPEKRIYVQLEITRTETRNTYFLPGLVLL